MNNQQFQHGTFIPKWGIINAFFTSVGRLAQIEGRAGRIEYWYIQSLPILSLIILLFIPPAIEFFFIEYFGLLFFFVCLQCLLFIAAFSVATRRLHDLGLSEVYLVAGIFFMLLSSWMINLQAGYVVYLTLSIIIGCLPGKQQPNKYGESQLPPLSPSPNGKHWNIANAYKSCMKHMFQISGRSCCSEYTIFCLIYAFMCTVPTGIVTWVHILSKEWSSKDRIFIVIILSIMAVLLILYLLALTIAFISATIRRLHDCNHSGFILLPWLIISIFAFTIAGMFDLLILAPLIILPWFVILKILLTPGEKSKNSYGTPFFPPVRVTHK